VARFAATLTTPAGHAALGVCACTEAAAEEGAGEGEGVCVCRRSVAL
jgi:hypothetical protein